MMKTSTFLRFAVDNCRDEAARQWFGRNSESFSQLTDVYLFLKKRIDEEEAKNHSSNVHIVLVSHGETRDSMIPASCLLPLSNITDVLLESPRTHWTSVRKAGDQMIPNIVLRPLKPSENIETHSQPGRNCIIIPFILPGQSRDRVPLSVVTLGLALVLLSSRFKATVRLCACLTEASAGQRLHGEGDVFSRRWTNVLKHFMVKHRPRVCLWWWIRHDLIILRTMDKLSYFLYIINSVYI